MKTLMHKDMKNNRFDELLTRYLADVATEAEREELMQLIRDGDQESTIKSTIGDMLAEGRVNDEMVPGRADEILGEILESERSIRSTNWYWYAAAASFAVLISVGLWFFTQEQRLGETLAEVTQSGNSPVIVKGKQFVRLPDGSTALLNDGTSLSYAQGFADSIREVVLVGEAYFDVAHDPARPFRVVTGKITTTVLGTSFNISAYPDDHEVKVTVTRGKVQVDTEQDILGIITPDQQISVNTVTYDFTRSTVKASEVVKSLQSQYLILDNVSLEEAAKTISEKYHVTITFSNERLKACRISATFLNGENLEQVLTVVSGVVQAGYEISPGGDVSLDGKGCESAN